jgi:hypothetical protein
VKHWHTWISNTTNITGETLIYMKVFDIYVYQCFTSYSCSVRYSCISMFHQLYLYCWVFMYINASPVILAWISNTTSITGETLIYMNIKHYKYNWWNIDIHEYKTRHAQLVKHWYRWISNTPHITGEMFHQLYF